MYFGVAQAGVSVAGGQQARHHLACGSHCERDDEVGREITRHSERLRM